MKKIFSIFFIIGIFILGSLVGCSGNSSDKGGKEKNLKVGASVTPHAEVLEHIKPKLKEEGINLEIITLDSEDQLNPALADKQIDANYFQHTPYLESVSKEKGYDFEVAGKIHIEPIGFYSNTIKSISELKNGDKIGIPNNPSNEFRALKLLEKYGVIKLKDGITDYSATPSDIAENPKNINFVELEAATLPRALADLSGAIINTNIVIEAGLSPDDAIVKEDSDSPYANIIAVRKGDEEREDIKKLIEILQSDDVKKFLKDKYGSAIVPAF